MSSEWRLILKISLFGWFEKWLASCETPIDLHELIRSRSLDQTWILCVTFSRCVHQLIECLQIG